MDSVSASLPSLEVDGASGHPELVDPFGRAITYLRVSVTDRCDFRCVYCMAENMSFLPKAEVLTLEELDRLCSAFVARGVRKLRLTGGEPLVRRGIMTLVTSLSRHLRSGALDELTLDHQRLAARQICRGARRGRHPAHQRLARYARCRKNSAPSRAGARWIRCWPGSTPRRPPASKIKINTVALKGVNDDEFPRLIEWAHGRGMDLTLIEVMPLGEIGEGRLDQYLPLSLVRARLAERFTLEDIDYRTGGPARYVRVAETGGRLGFITPLTHNFCESLQSRARHLHRHALHVPRPGGCRRSAQAAARFRRQRSACSPPSTKRSRASPRATISSSIAATSARRWRGT